MFSVLSFMLESIDDFGKVREHKINIKTIAFHYMSNIISGNQKKTKITICNASKKMEYLHTYVVFQPQELWGDI